MNYFGSKFRLVCLALVLVLCLSSCTGRESLESQIKIEQKSRNNNIISSLFDLDEDGREEIVLFEEEKFVRYDGKTTLVKKVRFLASDLKAIYQEITVNERGSLNFRRDNQSGEIFLGITYVQDGWIRWREYNGKSQVVHEVNLAEAEDNNNSGMWEGNAKLVTFLDTNQDGEKDPVFVISAHHDRNPRKIIAIDLKSKRVIWEKSFQNYIDIDNVKVFDHNNDGKRELVVSTCAMGHIVNAHGKNDYSHLYVIAPEGKFSGRNQQVKKIQSAVCSPPRAMLMAWAMRYFY